MTPSDKLNSLRKKLSEMGSVLIAFSGGTDSSFLLRVARDTIGQSAGATTANSSLLAKRHLERAKRFTQDQGLKHVVVPTAQLADPDFVSNSEKRCYYCARIVYSRLLGLAKDLGIAYVANGTNLDDSNDYRPGATACDELGVRSPLREAHLTKSEIRYLSKEMGLPTWNQPPDSCLATRIPYGIKITQERLNRIEAAEELLLGLGFRNLRARDYDETVRIELAAPELSMAVGDPTRGKLVDGLKSCGYSYVSLDLEGYRAGSMNKTAREEDGR